jgi:hypothetical protein
MAAKLTTLTQNSDTTAPSGRELYNLLFSLQAASPETFGYTLVIVVVKYKKTKEVNSSRRNFFFIHFRTEMVGCFENLLKYFPVVFPKKKKIWIRSAFVFQRNDVSHTASCSISAYSDKMKGPKAAV